MPLPQGGNQVQTPRTEAQPLCEEDALARNLLPLKKAEVCGGVKEDALTHAQRLAQLSPYLAEFAGCVLQALAWNCSELGIRLRCALESCGIYCRGIVKQGQLG